MAKRRKNESQVKVLANITNAAVREERVAALRDGRKERANRFTDRKAEASRTACRKGAWA